MPSGVDSDCRWKLSYMSAQPVAVLGAGTDPPPDSTDPIRYVARSDTGLSAARSACVICPTLSSSDMRDSRSFTLAATLRLGSLYGGVSSALAGCGCSTTPNAARASITRTGILNALIRWRERGTAVIGSSWMSPRP